MNSESSPTRRSAKPLLGAPRIGRYVGIATFWLLAVFVIGASTRSVVGQLFGIAAAAPAIASDEQACARTLSSLHDSLLQQASAEIRLPRDPSRLSHWLAEWDRTYATLDGHCSSLEPARRHLLSLRQQLEQMLHQHAREHIPLTESIRRALDRFQLGPARPSKET